MTPGGSFSPRMERPQGGHSVLGWNDLRGSFSPRMELPQGVHSVLGWNNPRGVIQCYILYLIYILYTSSTCVEEDYLLHAFL